MSDIHTSAVTAHGVGRLPIGARSTKFQIILLRPDAAIHVLSYRRQCPPTKRAQRLRQRTVNREMTARQQLLLQQCRDQLTFRQPVAVFDEAGGNSDEVLDAEPHKQGKTVLSRSAQPAIISSDSVEWLQQQIACQLFGEVNSRSHAEAALKSLCREFGKLYSQI